MANKSSKHLTKEEQLSMEMALRRSVSSKGEEIMTPIYRCPVCGVTDPRAYLRCSRPDCTDGRDPRPTAERCEDLKDTP